MLLAVGPVWAESSLRHELLEEICLPGDIHGERCERAIDYPEFDEACDVDLSHNEKAEGRFMGGSHMLLLMTYGSDCEPHAHEFGGALVFEKETGRYRFRGYQPGMVVKKCHVEKDKDGRRDRLFCATASTHQGVTETTRSEVLFGRDYEGNIGTLLNVLVSSSSVTGR
jgi:hypothetical protein